MKTVLLLSLLILGRCVANFTNYEYSDYDSDYDEEVNRDTVPPEITDGYEEAIPTTDSSNFFDVITLDDFIRWFPWVTMAAFIAFSLIAICCIVCACKQIIKNHRSRSNAMAMEMREL